MYIFEKCIKINKRARQGSLANAKKEDTYMAYVITEACVSCGACAAQCPVEAISEGAAHYEIDAETCVECGACAAQCPVEAIEEA